jgi:hypothetical protein
MLSARNQPAMSARRAEAGEKRKGQVNIFVKGAVPERSFFMSGPLFRTGLIDGAALLIFLL